MINKKIANVKKESTTKHQSQSQDESQEMFDEAFWRRLGAEIIYLSGLLKEYYEDQEKDPMAAAHERALAKKP